MWMAETYLDCTCRIQGIHREFTRTQRHQRQYPLFWSTVIAELLHTRYTKNNTYLVAVVARAVNLTTDGDDGVTVAVCVSAGPETYFEIGSLWSLQIAIVKREEHIANCNEPDRYEWRMSLSYRVSRGRREGVDERVKSRKDTSYLSVSEINLYFI